MLLQLKLCLKQEFHRQQLTACMPVAYTVVHQTAMTNIKSISKYYIDCFSYENNLQ